MAGNQSYTLVTQSFGREYEYRRVTLAILSFYSFADKDVPTILFTDNPGWFAPYLKDFPVQYVLLTPEKIKTMRGKIDFLHRMKIALIEEAFQISGTHLLYSDSDTFFQGNPVAYFAGMDESKSYMHLHEYEFEYLRNMALPAGKTFRDFLDIIEHRKLLLADGSELPLSAKNSSWNAGVMLLHASHSRWIPDVYTLTDQFYPDSKNHASEQYAFSVLLQTRTHLQACEELVYHYWYNVKKKIIDIFLEQRLSGLQAMSVDEKLATVKKWTQELPALFDSHVLALKDNAVQTFNNKEFGAGLKWAFRAFAKGAWRDTTFIKDVLYHTKNKLLNK